MQGRCSVLWGHFWVLAWWLLRRVQDVLMIGSIGAIFLMCQSLICSCNNHRWHLKGKPLQWGHPVALSRYCLRRGRGHYSQYKVVLSHQSCSGRHISPITAKRCEQNCVVLWRYSEHEELVFSRWNTSCFILFSGRRFVPPPEWTERRKRQCESVNAASLSLPL